MRIYTAKTSGAWHPVRDRHMNPNKIAYPSSKPPRDTKSVLELSKRELIKYLK